MPTFSDKRAVSLLKILFIASIFVLALFSVKDTDFGWHYRCGLEFMQSGTVCSQNTFSYFLPGHPWAYSSLIYDVILAAAFDGWGFVGVSAVGAAVLALTMYVLHLAFRTGESAVKYLAVFIVMAMSWTVIELGFRSQLMSLLFYSILLLMINRLKKQEVLRKMQKLLYASCTVVLFILWTNSHPGFFVGLLTLGFYAFIELRYKRFFPLVLFIAAMLSTGLNSFGFRVYAEIWQHFNSPLGRMIAEWVRPDYWQMAVIVALSSALAWSLLKHRPEDWLFAIMILSLTTYLALTARRNLPLFYMTAAYVLFEIKTFQDKLTGYLNRSVSFGIVLTGLMIGLLMLPGNIRFNSDMGSYCRDGQSELPCLAVERLENEKANIYSLYEWGGYLIWKLPQSKVFVDGRMPAWKDTDGRSPYEVYLDIIQAKRGWQKTLDRHNTDLLLIKTGTFLDLELAKKTHPEWQQTYRDDVAVIYRRIR